MVAMVAAGNGRADRLATMPTGERVLLVGLQGGLRRCSFVPAGLAGSNLFGAGTPTLGATGIPDSAMGRQRKLLLDDGRGFSVG